MSNREKARRKEEIRLRREAKQKKKEEDAANEAKSLKLAEKLHRKEIRRLKELKEKEEELRKSKEQSPQINIDSSSSDDGDDVSYQHSKGEKKEKKKEGSSKKYAAISFNYSSISNNDHKPLFHVPAGKLPHFDGTNFAKWKHLIKAYLVGLHPSAWEIVHDGFEPPVNPTSPTPTVLRCIQLNAQATSVLLSALDGDEYNKVMGLEVAKEIWDTLHLAHEGVNKVKQSKIDLLMAKLNRFVIMEGEGPQEMFDRLMVIVGKIRGLGGEEVNDHKVVKIMLEAYSPRNETIVTLIRDKKKFEYFTPSDVLGRILTFDLQREEALERRRLGELQARMDGMKIKDVALKANKNSKQSALSSSKNSKQLSSSQSKSIKPSKQEVETTSSSEGESDGEQYEKIDDMALFMRRFNKGIKKNGYKLMKRRFPNKKRRTCYNCGSTEHFIADCPNEKKENKYNKSKREDRGDHKKNKRYMGKAHIGHEWDSTKESSSEDDEKVATIAIHKSSTTPRLFNNMSDDCSPHICLMAKDEKVKPKPKSKTPSPSDISSSDTSDYSSDDESSDEEIDNITKNLDSKTKLFIAKLIEELEGTKAELTSREKTLIKQEDLYIASKEAIALERSEVSSLKKGFGQRARSSCSHKEGQY
ncbi:DEK domain-containing chromatin-associated protein 4-like [Miscanthus floridulus]|uniref:DEK domain-containing chromatin-associated protein 4-like n=1 Tax=Miscanthus floridulus TaxID=154761 RepID=UPI00345A73BD